MDPSPSLDAAAAKAALRRELRARRKALDPASRAAETMVVCARIWADLLAAGSPPLAAYAAMAGEFDLAPLFARCWAAGTPVWLPRISGPGALTWHPVRQPAELIPGPHGIPEPDPMRAPAQPLPVTALVLVPGVGFTADGARLGQGGGFYDRFLVGHPGPRAGVCYRCQLVAEVPVEVHDQRLPVVYHA